MARMMIAGLCLAFIAGAAMGQSATQPASTQPTSASQPAGKSKTDPAGLPLEARLILKKDTYTLKADQSGEAFAKKVKDSAKPGAQPPSPPDVEMAFDLTNTGKKAITIPLGSDSSRLDLKLEGQGVATVAFAQMMTMEFRMGKPTTIEPGKSITIPITKLLHGMRGTSNASYWTAAGTYTITASYVTTISGLDPNEHKVNEDQQVTITAAPVTVKVVEK